MIGRAVDDGVCARDRSVDLYDIHRDAVDRRMNSKILIDVVGDAGAEVNVRLPHIDIGGIIAVDGDGGCDGVGC